jgi:hypothetical protein
MCFSATASFTASMVLIPTGIYCLRESLFTEKTYLAFACWPLFFGLQQILEGFVWLGIENNDIHVINLASLGFLFFSHFFWLLWTPFSSFYLETNPTIRSGLMILTGLGCCYGVALYFPLISREDFVNVQVINGSIHYRTTFIFQELVPTNFTIIFYIMIILGSLFLSSNRQINIFGWQIFVAAIATQLVFNYAFTSVWCFFAAGLSMYLAYTIKQETKLSEYVNPK